MASCDPFSVPFSGSAQDLFNKISLLIHQHGGNISGGPSGGAFSVPVPVFGTVAGTFTVAGQRCPVHVTERSFFLPCSRREGGGTDVLKDQPAARAAVNSSVDRVESQRPGVESRSFKACLL
jgi:hypothetical protein